MFCVAEQGVGTVAERKDMVGKVVRVAVGVCGVGALVLAFGFLVQPDILARRLGLQADGPLGLSTLRGDMSGLFALIGVFSVAAALRRRADYLAAPIFLLTVILAGRGLSALVDGSGVVALDLIGVEIVMLVVLVLGLRMMARPVRV